VGLFLGLGVVGVFYFWGGEGFGGWFGPLRGGVGGSPLPGRGRGFFCGRAVQWGRALVLLAGSLVSPGGPPPFPFGLCAGGGRASPPLGGGGGGARAGRCLGGGGLSWWGGVWVLGRFGGVTFWVLGVGDCLVVGDSLFFVPEDSLSPLFPRIHRSPCA